MLEWSKSKTWFVPTLVPTPFLRSCILDQYWNILVLVLGTINETETRKPLQMQRFRVFVKRCHFIDSIKYFHVSWILVLHLYANIAVKFLYFCLRDKNNRWFRFLENWRACSGRLFECFEHGEYVDWRYLKWSKIRVGLQERGERKTELTNNWNDGRKNKNSFQAI